MYLALRKKFIDALETLDYLLEVDITDDRLLIASRGHQGCVLNKFSERCSISLVLIRLRRSKVIVGMNLGLNGAMIDCEFQLSRVRIPSCRELAIHGEGDQDRLTVCLSAIVRRCIQ